MCDKIHPFEKAGLGNAPFKYVGTSYEVGPMKMADGITTIGAPGQPMGTCDYCGQGIAYVCRVESADGKIFRVGMDCVNKLFRDDNKTPSQQARANAQDPVWREIDRKRRQIQREQRHKREDRRIAEGSAKVEQCRQQLSEIPHTLSYWAEQGQTAWDQYEWAMKNAGRSGTLQAIARALKLLEESQAAKGRAAVESWERPGHGNGPALQQMLF